MTSPRAARAALVALVASAALALGGCAASSPSPSTTATTSPTTSSPTASSTSQAAPSDGPPSGAPGAGPTGKTMTPEATAKMAGELGVTPTELTAAITKARSGGAGVNLVKTLSSELDVSETKVAAALKDMGPDGP